MPKGGPGRGQGRPKFEPTPADRNTVKTMIAVGISQERIARCIGTYGITEKTLRKYFKRELEISHDMMLASVGGVTIAAAQRGESWACQLIMKCRAGWREASALELTGKDGAALVDNSTQVNAVVNVFMEALEPAPQEIKTAVARRLIELERGTHHQ